MYVFLTNGAKWVIWLFLMISIWIIISMESSWRDFFIDMVVYSFFIKNNQRYNPVYLPSYRPGPKQVWDYLKVGFVFTLQLTFKIGYANVSIKTSVNLSFLAYSWLAKIKSCEKEEKMHSQKRLKFNCAETGEGYYSSIRPNIVDMCSRQSSKLGSYLLSVKCSRRGGETQELICKGGAHAVQSHWAHEKLQFSCSA